MRRLGRRTAKSAYFRLESGGGQRREGEVRGGYHARLELSLRAERAGGRAVPGMCGDAGHNLLGYRQGVAAGKAVDARRTLVADRVDEILHLQGQGVDGLETLLPTRQVLLDQMRLVVLDLSAVIDAAWNS